jgi:predicted nucleic acid-binding protein
VTPTVTPGQARRLIEENIADIADDIVGLDGNEYLTVLQRMTDLGLESGAVYDALHVRCAEKASADELRTFNGRDFRRMPPMGDTTLVVL